MTDSRNKTTPQNILIKNGSVWQTILLILIAIVIWQIYYPGIMSPDSIEQYGQALEGSFVDWHPPLMAVVLSAVFKMGGGIGAMIFIQCLAALFGLRSAILNLLLFFSNRNISKPSSQLIATASVILFIIPFLTPYMYISVIFWKDAWLAIMLLWIISYLIWIYFNLESFTKRNFIFHILIFSLLSSMIVLVRHNAFVIIPIFGLFAAAIGKIKFGKVGWVFGAAPLLIAFSLNPVFDTIFNIQHVKAGNLVVASDLTTMLLLYPELKPEYPATIQHKNNPRQTPKDLIVELGSDNVELQNEYAKTLAAHPVQFLSAKLYRFGQMLTYENSLKQRLAYDIIGNPYGLKINVEHSDIRYKLNRLVSETGNKWYFIWISGLHIIWLSVGIILSGYFLSKIILKKNLESVFSFLLFLIPLSYYFSYLLAATTPDYRFMYPATLIMQVNVVGLILGKILPSFKKQESKVL